jgi:hypothetical protein
MTTKELTFVCFIDTSFDITIPSVFLPQSEYQQLLYAQQKRQPLLVLLEDADKLPR